MEKVIHIYTGSFTPLPGPHPRYRRLISTRRGGLTTNGIHLCNTPLTVQLTVATSVATSVDPPLDRCARRSQCYMRRARHSCDGAAKEPPNGVNLP